MRLLEDASAAPLGLSPRSKQPKADDKAAALERGYVLVVGTDVRARTHMLCELRDVLPSSTRFLETEEAWEALALAERSQMVVLVGDLEDLSGASMVRLLARRQPALPVLAVGSEASPPHPHVASG